MQHFHATSHTGINSAYEVQRCQIQAPKRTRMIMEFELQE